MNTGSRSNCVSDVGAFDLVGNLNEWVADWVPLSIGDKCLPPLFTEPGDFNCVGGARTDSGTGALLRGGEFNDGTSAGVFAVSGVSAPSDAGSEFGFRAAR